MSHISIIIFNHIHIMLTCIWTIATNNDLKNLAEKIKGELWHNRHVLNMYYNMYYKLSRDLNTTTANVVSVFLDR